MNATNPDPERKSCCEANDAAATCCETEAGNVSSCCSPKDRLGSKSKLLISAIIIIAAIGVGANSLVRGTSAQTFNTGPVKSLSAGLTQIPAMALEKNYQGKPQAQQMSLDRVLDSLQSLDTLAADKDVVFLVLPGAAGISSVSVPKQVGAVASNLWNSGQRIAVFTLRIGTSDHDRLVRHFSVKDFPCVVVLGRQGQPSAVAGDITEAGLYSAFVLASTPNSCCPGQSNPSCCPK